MIPQRVANRKVHSEAFEIAVNMQNQPERSKQAPKKSLEILSKRKNVTSSGANTPTTKQKSNVNEKVECPICNIRIDKKFIGSHINNHEVNRKLTSRHKKMSLPVKKKKYVLCNICGVTVNEQRLERHKRRIHGGQLANKTSTDSKKQTTTSHNTNIFKLATRCPICGKQFLPSLYASHEKACFAKKTSHKTIIKKKSPNKKNAENKLTAKPRQQPSMQGRGTDKKIDATYGHHTIRDQGRFGSHPSHDNFDDESTP